MWHVYILECMASTGRKTVHVGVALDVMKRVGEHREGKVKATRGRKVHLLGYSEAMSKRAALRCEILLKKLTPVEKRAWGERWRKTT